ncbi:hypothetical protein [Phyllobacterium endophyticum]|uniref:hypothetical protein n=1 Tax=Phyllobacterium endophyticum TaxID=1149773 RepID=UPI0011CB72AB|nr:hypothetical protein [Phyllobacterium endophyticum]TXR50377.1 hypothetical protein FVA77_03450 [Phyllobacterium endophyticum]
MTKVEYPPQSKDPPLGVTVQKLREQILGGPHFGSTMGHAEVSVSGEDALILWIATSGPRVPRSR